MSNKDRNATLSVFGRLGIFWRYFGVALVTFLAAHVGGSALARHRVSGASWNEAWNEVFYYLIDPIGLLFFFLPFLALALLSAHFQKRARLRGVLLTFGAGIGVLTFFYIDQHYWSELATQEERWTAASLAVGILPFLIGVPVVLVVAALQALAARFDARAVAVPTIYD